MEWHAIVTRNILSVGGSFSAILQPVLRRLYLHIRIMCSAVAHGEYENAKHYGKVYLKSFKLNTGYMETLLLCTFGSTMYLLMMA
jgi:hypothetical protein